MRISVVIPTFNRRETVLRSVKTLIEQDYPASQYEIVVVVDGSTDGSAASLRALRPACSFQVIEQANRGQAAARNTGWRAAENELIIFLDDDMLCDTTLVGEHLKAHDKAERTIGVGRILLSSDSPRTLAAECFLLELGGGFSQQQQPGTELPFSGAVVSNTSVKRELLVETGGFDERFQMREDADLCARLLSNGAHLRSVSSAVAHQYYTKRTADLIRDAEAFAIADVLFVREHPELAAELFVGRIAREPIWRRTCRRVASSLSALADALLAPFCLAGESLPSMTAVRRMGIRAVQLRRGIHYYGAVLKAAKDDSRRQ
jgi:GT2 family glycosyltransferase